MVLHPCALDENNLNIGRVNSEVQTLGKKYSSPKDISQEMMGSYWHEWFKICVWIITTTTSVKIPEMAGYLL